MTEGLDRNQLLAWVERKIEELERDLQALYAFRAMLVTKQWRPGEKIEEIRYNRRTKIAHLYIGEDYIRLVPLFEMPDAREIRLYLSEIKNEIREYQARNGAEKHTNLSIRTNGDGTIAEVMYDNLSDINTMIKAKAALKHAASIGYEIYRAIKRNNSH